MLPCLSLSSSRWQQAKVQSSLGCPRPTRRQEKSEGLAAKAKPRLNAEVKNLRKVPGIGSRAADILVNTNIDSVPELCRLYKDEYRSDKVQFARYLEARSQKFHFFSIFWHTLFVKRCIGFRDWRKPKRQAVA